MTPDAAEPITIPLDRVHTAVRRGDHWTLSRRLPSGAEQILDGWTGPRRSIYARLDDLGIAPSRDAEQALGNLPEATAFRDR